GENVFGLGTKVFSYSDGKLQYKELYPVRGFQASSEPIVHFGYGKSTTVDSLKVVWPDGNYQVLRDVATNQTMTLSPSNTKPFDYGSLLPKPQPLFKRIVGNLGINFKHEEDNYTDFNRQKLIPYQLSDRGPATALGDLNDDGKTDIFFGGSKFYPAKVYVQNDSTFTPQDIPSMAKDSIKEDVSATIADFTGDGKNDLMVGSGGGDFYNKMPPLLDSYYIQGDSTFVAGQLPENFENASIMAPNDFDGDGDLDIFVGNQAVTNDFGKLPNSFLLKNTEGLFEVIENADLQNLGMVTDAIWNDFDGDGQDDLIVVGEWMAPVFFRNLNGKLVRTETIGSDLTGLWQSIAPFDIDGDGDIDYLLGNWGTNSKFTASQKSPLKMYYDDFDENGQSETITAVKKEGEYYPLENLDGLASQMVFLKRKFNTYTSFAGKSIDEILDKKSIEQAKILEAYELRSGFLRNDNGNFSFVPFQNELQVSPLMAFVSHDFDGDGKVEVLVAGNYFGVKPYQGRFDSFPGALIIAENNVVLGSRIGLNLSHNSVRHLNIIDYNEHSYLLVTINNDSTQVYKVNPKDKTNDIWERK
uniref:FG-GAP-like repeat-containing protein n=1 Tax=Pricia sp. TaxID=2268138 RepID=UPI0035930152